MFDEDSQTGKGKYSMDGGSTWQNFSSGADYWDKVVVSTIVMQQPYYYPINIYKENTLVGNFNCYSVVSAQHVLFWLDSFDIIYYAGGSMSVRAYDDIIVNGTLLHAGDSTTPVSYATANPYTITKP